MCKTSSGTLSSRLPWVLNVEARCHQRGDYKDGWREKLIALRIFFLCQSVENIAVTVILSGWRYFAVTWGMNGENHQLMQFSSERFSCTSILSLFHFYGTNWINPDSLEARYPILILFKTHKIHTAHTLSAYWVILKYYRNQTSSRR